MGKEKWKEYSEKKAGHARCTPSRGRGRLTSPEHKGEERQTTEREGSPEGDLLLKGLRAIVPTSQPSSKDEPNSSKRKNVPSLSSKERDPLAKLVSALSELGRRGKKKGKRNLRKKRRKGARLPGKRSSSEGQKEGRGIRPEACYRGGPEGPSRRKEGKSVASAAY